MISDETRDAIKRYKKAVIANSWKGGCEPYLVQDIEEEVVWAEKVLTEHILELMHVPQYKFSVEKGQLVSMLKDLLCTPSLWCYNSKLLGVRFKLPEESKDEIQKEIFEWLKIRVEPTRELVRHQPCGCIVCNCDIDNVCQGCGSRVCDDATACCTRNPDLHHKRVWIGR